MPESVPSPAVWVQLAQALIARELVEGLGLAEREAAERLGIGPSAVSQYLSGKRLGERTRRLARDDGARRIARRTAQVLVGSARREEALAVLLGAAGELARRFESTGTPGAGPAVVRPEAPAPDPGLQRWVRSRIQGEQVAVAECMRLAQRSHDELTRALFRQIASDSLRHAEIVASIGAYLDRGITRTGPSGLSRADVERLIARERAAEASEGPSPGPSLGGVMGILWESMEADERKHAELLERLLASLETDRPRPERRPRRSAPAAPA